MSGHRPGVRPSPAAATSTRTGAAEIFPRLTALHVAAPGDAALYANRDDPFPCRRGATVLECGDSSPLWRRRLVAVELPFGSAHAGALALARAENAPFHLHASRSLTATSRLEKAVTSPRTPPSLSFDCARPLSAAMGRSPRLLFNRRSATIHLLPLRSVSRAAGAGALRRRAAGPALPEGTEKLQNLVRNMNTSAPSPPPSSPVTSIALAMVLGNIAVLACGIPFVPPLAVVAVPLASASLFLLGRVLICGCLAQISHAHFVAQASKPAVSRVSKPAGRPARPTPCRLGSRRHGRFGNLRYKGVRPAAAMGP